MRLVIWLSLIGGLCCVLAACSAMPPAVETPTVEFTQILFESFDNKNNNWDEFEDDLGKAWYDGEGTYHIKVTKTNAHIWSYPLVPQVQSLRDVVISVEAQKFNNTTNNLYGVICRYEDQANFYFFVVSSDGHFGIGKVIDGSYQLINRNDYPPSSVILEQNQAHRIRAECVGSQLSLYVNDQWVDQQTDTDLLTGRVGIIAGTLDGEAEIVFDNFEVRGLSP